MVGHVAALQHNTRQAWNGGSGNDGEVGSRHGTPVQARNGTSGSVGEAPTRQGNAGVERPGTVNLAVQGPVKARLKYNLALPIFILSCILKR